MDALLSDSLEKSSHVTIDEINTLLLDCTPQECKLLFKLLKVGKDIIRTDGVSRKS